MNFRTLALLPFLSSIVLPYAASQTAAPALAASALTAVPPLVLYSGQVESRNGQISMTFLIYKDQQGGEPLFAETQTVAIDAAGHYEVQLGAANPYGLPANLFATGEARWLEVQITGQPAEARVLLASVPYAFKAADAATLGGLPASAFVLAGSRSSSNAVSAEVSPDTASNVTTTGGVSGYLPEFSGASSIVDSPLFISGANLGIGTTTPASTLDVNGTALLSGLLIANGGATLVGPLELAPVGTATAATGHNSQFLKIFSSAYNSTSKTVVNPRFEWEALATGNNTAAPSATLNLLSSTTSAGAAETGFYFNANGTINFAPGQTFPGADITGTVNATSYDLAGSSFATGSTSSGTAYLGFASNTSSTGDDDTGVGYQALHTNTTGSNNTAIGFDALYSNSTGTYNTASGDNALDLNTTGNYNTASGFEALISNTTGSYNTASGFAALFYNTTGSQNTGLGYGAGPDSLALAYATAIGANATVSQSNSLVLGQTAAGSPGESYVNVGIGTATPRSALDAVVGALGKLGPVLTLTNSEGGVGASAAVDFNSYGPSTSGTYNPAARIQALDDNWGDDLAFFANVQGAPNQGLQTNMFIAANGNVAVGAFASTAAGTPAQFTSMGENGNQGIYAQGSDGVGDNDGAQGITVYGGDGAGNGSGGDGIDAYNGTSNSSGSGYAGLFQGDVEVFGTLSANSKDLKIDHPLDPADKYLVHASVESSEQMNIYTGNVVTDELGLATVKLPGWFEAENSDFRYQLTVIGQFAQAIIKDKIANGQFRIMTNASHVEVSWLVTGVRQDAYAKAHPLIVEQEKPERERGFYRNPELFGQPEEKQTEWGRRPQQMQHMKEMRGRQKLVAQQQNDGSQAGKTLSHDQPASAVNRTFVHRAVSAVLPQTPDTKPKPVSQAAN